MAGKINYTNQKPTFSQMDEAYRYALQSNTNFSFFAGEHVLCRWTYRLISIGSIWEKLDGRCYARHSRLNQSKLMHLVFLTHSNLQRLLQ